jgi:hypothetical protein
MIVLGAERSHTIAAVSAATGELPYGNQGHETITNRAGQRLPIPDR